jgi:hypothetical protein
MQHSRLIYMSFTVLPNMNKFRHTVSFSNVDYGGTLWRLFQEHVVHTIIICPYFATKAVFIGGHIYLFFAKTLFVSHRFATEGQSNGVHVFIRDTLRTQLLWNGMTCITFVKIHGRLFKSWITIQYYQIWIHSVLWFHIHKILLCYTMNKIVV